MFSSAEYVFKDGDEIVRNGKSLKYKKTSTQALKINYDKNIHKKIEKWFENFYSLNLEDFEVDENFFENKNFKYLKTC